MLVHLGLTLALSLIAPFAGDVAGDHGGRPIGSLFACDRPVTPPRCTSVADDRRHFVFFDETRVYCPRDAPQGINTSGDRWCRQQELHLNLNARYAVFFADDPSRDHVTCHELGATP